MSDQSTIREWIEKYGADVLTERSMSRLLGQVESGESFALITAFRVGLTLKENVKLNEKLLQDIRSAGLGAARTQGTYDMTRTDGTKQRMYEESFFVYKMPKKTAIKLADKYEQDSVLWGQKGIGVFYVLPNGSATKIGTKLSLNVLIRAYSQIKGKRFTFEAIAFIQGGHANSLAWLADRSIWVRARVRSSRQ